MPTKPDTGLPKRFAKLMIAGIADLQAVVQTLSDFAVADLAYKLQKEGMSQAEALKEAKKVYEAKRKPRAERYAADLLRRLNLPD